MKKIIIYSYSKCSTCRKALNWLGSNNFKYRLIDIVENPPSFEHLDLALKQYIADKKKIFNTRGKSFKSIDIDIYTLQNEEIIKLLFNDGKLIKRPFLVYENKKIILGFNEIEYSNFFIGSNFIVKGKIS